ncbi:MAG: BolA/IbaG family iron-sulfur metabolism protein [Gammaproteobacteria bacterium]
MEPSAIKQFIESRLDGAEAHVEGDGRHFEAVVICDQFADKSLIQQHQLVYGVIKEEMANDSIHALSLKTYTQDGWQQANS